MLSAVRKPRPYLCAEQRVRAAGVVAEHAAERAVAVRRGVGGEVQALLVGGVAQIVQHAARLNDAELLVGVDAEDAVHVFGEVHDDGDVTALAAEAGAAAAQENGCAKRCAAVIVSTTLAWSRGMTTPMGTWR